MFEKLPKETRDLVVSGYYGLFELIEPQDEFKYILIKSSDSALLLSEDGSKVEHVGNPDNYKIGSAIHLESPDEDEPLSEVFNSIINSR